jgi:hypothetical protein
MRALRRRIEGETISIDLPSVKRSRKRQVRWPGTVRSEMNLRP